MQITDFTPDWIPDAQRLILSNCRKERTAVPLLPENIDIPDLTALAENGLGIAAVEDGRLLGFLSAYGPFKPVFCTRDTCGVFSPLHAHAVQKAQRVRIWQRLYQAAAEKWVRAGAASHAITLYAHDGDARNALYLYGFGVRCMDLIRQSEPTGAAGGWVCRELPHAQHVEITPLRLALADHLSKSPSFMLHTHQQLDRWLSQKAKAKPRVFVAEHEGQIAAYMELEEDGESFISCHPDMLNICGAYCLPAYRGTGAAQALLDHVLAACRAAGKSRLGVDCESFNPTALGFWGKHFTAYSHSVVRRIDDHALL